jgi:hypothetical protein
MKFNMQEAELDGSGVLWCPRCRENYLHQTNTTIFVRQEDAKTTTVIAQNGDTAQVAKFPSTDTCNPSPRRNGLTIEFECEMCHGELEGGKENTLSPFQLAIFQHKGNTYVEWV